MAPTKYTARLLMAFIRGPSKARVTVLNEARRSKCLNASSSIQPDRVIATMVSISAKPDQVVQAPAPELGRPSIPAPTHTPSIMQAPPTREGADLGGAALVTGRWPPASQKTHPDPEIGRASCRERE